MQILPTNIDIEHVGATLINVWQEWHQFESRLRRYQKRENL